MKSKISFKESMGILTLPFRLKRLSEQLQQDGFKLFRYSGTTFESKWFPVFCYLKEAGPTSVTDIARGLGVSHPGINQISKEMIAEGLVASYKDVSDKRIRVLALTSHGKHVIKEIDPLLRSIRTVLQEVADQSGDITFLDRLEHALDKDSLYERFVSRYEAPGYEVTLVTYKPFYRSAFARLNEEWINFYFELEERDRRILNDPERYIIHRGGEIFFALSDTNQVIGTCALVMHEGSIGELSKMAVVPEARGRGVGRMLGEAIISFARDKNLEQLFLETNSVLAPAIRLYRDLGFEEHPFPNKSSYGRADTYMVLSERE
ncbi:MAG: hypothetical protein CMQ33_07405 [Gammaproteobacteria bacterium]|nr:hypothetical protein [Gammaproteobacteria bacterium]